MYFHKKIKYGNGSNDHALKIMVQSIFSLNVKYKQKKFTLQIGNLRNGNVSFGCSGDRPKMRVEAHIRA